MVEEGGHSYPLVYSNNIAAHSAVASSSIRDMRCPTDNAPASGSIWKCYNLKIIDNHDDNKMNQCQRPHELEGLQSLQCLPYLGTLRYGEAMPSFDRLSTSDHWRHDKDDYKFMHAMNMMVPSFWRFGGENLTSAYKLLKGNTSAARNTESLSGFQHCRIWYR